ncbi:MAG: Uma2 family endonuclease [Verrucomicrobia bacterium]|nr:Uma2 family endonuclease [Verrucomicrobiota bacterium]
MARRVEREELSVPDFAPDICVEVQSPSDTPPKLREKAAAFFGVGVREVWVCDRKGKMRFYGPEGPLERSGLCPEFPDEIPAKFLR